MTEKIMVDSAHPTMSLHHPEPGVLFYALDDFYECMKSSRRSESKSLMFKACGSLTDTDEIKSFPLRIVPTSLRVVYCDDVEEDLPSYEFEGWVVGDYPERIWVFGVLYTGIRGQLEEGHIIRLFNGEESGTVPTIQGWV